MNSELCHTCQYEHNWIACSGCEHDNDEYVQAEWFAKKEAEIRADERKKCVAEMHDLGKLYSEIRADECKKFAKWLDENGYMKKMDLNISRVKEALYEYDKQIKGEQI